MGSLGSPSAAKTRSSPSARAKFPDKAGRFSGDGPRTEEVPVMEALRRGIGGGTASSSLFGDSSPAERGSSGGLSELTTQK